MEKIGIILFILIIIAGLMMIPAIIESEEKRECLQWQGYAKESQIFYLTSWQKKQCDRWGIKIDAPMKEGR